MIWYFAFIDNGKTGTWWDWFTRPGFRHVLSFRYDAKADVWLFVDWAKDGLYVHVHRSEDATPLIEAIKEHTVLEYDCKNDVKLFPFGASYCVSAACHLAGIPYLGVITPYRLYIVLKRYGAASAFTDE
jgi:hypothetical protein